VSGGRRQGLATFVTRGNCRVGIIRETGARRPRSPVVRPPGILHADARCGRQSTPARIKPLKVRKSGTGGGSGPSEKTRVQRSATCGTGTTGALRRRFSAITVKSTGSIVPAEVRLESARTIGGPLNSANAPGRQQAVRTCRRQQCCRERDTRQSCVRADSTTLDRSRHDRVPGSQVHKLARPS
jgi:hypothetical protein